MRRRRRKNKQIKFIMITSISLLFILTVGYAAFSTNLNISAKGNILEKSRVIKNWTKDSNEDFHTDVYRENIVTATFLDTNKVPDNAVESWDVSETKDKGVMAYIIPSTIETDKYDLFIGANGGVIANEDSGYLFYAFAGLKAIEFNDNFDTSNATTMHKMFSGGNRITTLDLSSFDTANVTNMYAMFTAWNTELSSWGNRSLTKIIFGDKFKTSNVVVMNTMFAGQLMTELDLSGFDTDSVTDMFHMFDCCEELKTIYVSNKFTTVNVNNSANMFYNDINLVGGNGTIYNKWRVDKEYARVDTASAPGYFTLKQ